MDLVREYWWLIAIAIAVALAVAFVVLRSRQRVKLTDSAPVRPHMAYGSPPEGRGLGGEAASAASAVAGDIISAPVRRALDADQDPNDDLCMIKGIGPKFADKLRTLGFHRYDQIAGLSPTEVDRLDAQLGAFAGRIARDRIVEQADYLARNDIDGFEQKFGKL
jgi:predicted flap endonuclease-1-like 5' DNA nuclease